MSSTKRKRKQFDTARLATLAYFDADAVTRYAPLSKRSYYAAIANGKLQAFRIGGTGKLVVRKVDLDRLLTATPAESRVKKIVDEVMSGLKGGTK